MTKATVTKTMKKFEAYEGPESLGFRRYWVLPSAMKMKLRQAHFAETGSIGPDANDRIWGFFGAMSEQDYQNWLLQA